MPSEKVLIVLTEPSELLLSAFSRGAGNALAPLELPKGGDTGAFSPVGRDSMGVSGCLASSNSLETVKLTEGHDVDSR
jgi:hypothetical protein